jgi:branched-chain amino acid transport system permease protein
MTTDPSEIREGYRAILRSMLSFREVLGALCLLVLIAMPVLVSEILILKLTGALFFAVFVMSWDLTSGYTGELSFGHSAFFGIGGYTTGVLNVHYGVDPMIGIVCGGVTAGVAGLLIGIPSLRVEGPYFGLVTLIVPLALIELLTFTRDLTGGQTGLIGVEKLTLETVTTYYISLGTFLVAMAIFFIVTRSDTGTILTAIREDKDAVVASGLNPSKYKIYAFTLSGLVGGLAAAVFVHTQAGSVTPSLLLALVVNINIIVAAILGGMGTITASAAGGVLFFMLQDYLNGVNWQIPLLNLQVSDFNVVLFFVVLLIFIFYIPEGVFKTLYEKMQEVIE